MPFEYDLLTSNSNRDKHRINFDEAQRLWDDEFYLEIPAKNLDEPRFLIIGKIDGKHWSVVITYRCDVQEMRRSHIMKTTASEFDKKFDDGENVSEDLDLSKTRRPAEEQKRINMDVPVWMLAALDREAKRLGVTRQSIIKVWLAERLQAGR